MSGPDFSGLKDLASNPEKAGQGFEPLTRDQLGYGQVLAFDQSLMATGWIAVTHTEQCFMVDGVDVIRGADGKQGVETDLSRGVWLMSRARFVIRTHPTYRLVHESPPNMAALKGKGSPVSSLLGAQSLRCAADVEYRDITMLGAQPAKKLVSGQIKDKKIAHDALKRYCFPWILGSERVTNEATRDALLIALLDLARSKT